MELIENISESAEINIKDFMRRISIDKDEDKGVKCPL